jgi:hypothetical protein
MRITQKLWEARIEINPKSHKSKLLLLIKMKLLLWINAKLFLAWRVVELCSFKAVLCLIMYASGIKINKIVERKMENAKANITWKTIICPIFEGALGAHSS